MSESFIAMPQVLEGHRYIRKQVKWGNYGITGEEELEVKYIKDLSNSHIWNILVTQPLDDQYKFWLSTELFWRLHYPTENPSTEGTNPEPSCQTNEG